MSHYIRNLFREYQTTQLMRKIQKRREYVLGVTLGSDRASSKGYIVRWVEAPSNKLLTAAFEASLESVTVTCRLSVDSKIAGIAMEHRNPKVSEGRHRGLGGRQYMHLSLW